MILSIYMLVAKLYHVLGSVNISIYFFDVFMMNEYAEFLAAYDCSYIVLAL